MEVTLTADMRNSEKETRNPFIMDLRDSILTGRKKTGVHNREFYSKAVLNDNKV